MSEKKKTWADVDGFRKQQEEAQMRAMEEKAKAESELTPEQMAELERFQMALQTAPLAVLDVLKKILAELRLANLTAFGKAATTDDEPVQFQVQDAGMAVEEPVTPPPVAPPTETPDLTVASNVEGEEAVVEYYKGRFREVSTRQGEKHSEEDLARFQFMFQEKDIKLRTPSLPTPMFAATARFVEDVLGGQYVGGKGAHFLLPYP